MQKLPIRKILIVDDEPDLCDALARIMRSQNVDCDRAENGLVAYNLISQNDYHVILSDIMMPTMTGLECMAQARAKGFKTPFVFLTGYGDKERILQAVRLGAVDFLMKPFETEDVLDVVFRAMDIGTRLERIDDKMKLLDLETAQSIKHEEKMIQLMRANNNKKRAA